MTTRTCERCGYTSASSTIENGCPRCVERAVRAQMRRFAGVQARHVRELRSGAADDGAVGLRRP